jgi:hypothetical protein
LSGLIGCAIKAVGVASLGLVEAVHFLGDFAELGNSLLTLVLLDGLRRVALEVESVLLFLGLLTFSHGASKEVFVFLFWEVHIVVSVRMRVLGWVVSVIFVERVGAKFLSVFPGLEFELAGRSASVEVRDLHGALVRLVIDQLGAKGPLLFLAETLQNEVWADLHNGDLLVEALGLVLISLAIVESADLTVATLGNLVWSEGQASRLKAVIVVLATHLGTEGLRLAVWVPLVVSLDVSVLLLQRVIEVSPKPSDLRSVAEHGGQLDQSVWRPFVSLSPWEQLLVGV